MRGCAWREHLSANVECVGGSAVRVQGRGGLSAAHKVRCGWLAKRLTELERDGLFEWLHAGMRFELAFFAEDAVLWASCDNAPPTSRG